MQQSVIPSQFDAPPGQKAPQASLLVNTLL